MTMRLKPSHHCLLLIPLLLFHSSAWTPSNFPNPKTHAAACNVHKGTQLCDPDRLISQAGHKLLRQELNRISKESMRQCGMKVKPGYNIGVALVREIPWSSFHFSTGNRRDAAFKFAKSVGHAWGLGHETCSQGMMLLISKTERVAHLRPVAGNGPFSALMQAALSEHLTEILSSNRDYEHGVIQAVELLRVMLGQTLQHHYISLSEDEQMAEKDEIHVSEVIPQVKTPLEVIVLILRTPAFTVLAIWHLASFLWWCFRCNKLKWPLSDKRHEVLFGTENEKPPLKNSLRMLPNLRCTDTREYTSDRRNGTAKDQTQRAKCKILSTKSETRHVHR
eukprot:CAMPEP_0114501968 /NCGR_PEP_ID=MMETSP0109-20121206/8792_1 /TAXON_ID=29199 /ORGANISM="Chlorarachnion reptans, Strain CCCM449" /LENGTH=334 /DNA_ID=CAMNT_0001679755 /DNA_START=274 /DNA_END=1278 /DNA_ORIENTATION=+